MATTALYAVFVSGTASRFSLAAMTLDRACAVLFPLKAKSICTASRAKKIVVISTIIPGMVDINIFFGFKIQFLGTEFASPFTEFKEHRWLEVAVAAYHSTANGVLPFTVILVSNILILISVKRAASERRKMAKDEKENLENAHLTRILVLVSMAFVVLCSPYLIFEVLVTIPDVMVAYDYSDIYWLLRIDVIFWSTVAFAEMNHAVNFYLYVLGGKKYRSDARNVLTVCIRFTR
ncbi:uncharacterized protein LOC135486113 [Lineus longissimus]|uniref:uncharacterized protein LOC135486113 n=1 Tax=Lineus longissimus TaxID=88925 RepID=UPI00315C8D2D